MALLNFAKVDQHQVSSSSSSMKLERKVVEKNRRTHMKALYSHLYALVPASHSNQGSAAAVADQIDEAIRYIKSSETKLKKLQDRKQSTLAKRRKRSYSSCHHQCCSRSCCSSKSGKKWSPAPELQIREVGSVVEVVLTSGSGRDVSIVLFQEMIQILEDERLEVLTASFAVTADSTFHSTVHAKLLPKVGSGAAKASERLQRLVYGSVSDPELEAELWGSCRLINSP